CPLTLSHSALLGAMEQQKARKVPGEAQTNIIDAVVLGLYRLKQAKDIGPRRKVMILLTDVEHNEEPASAWVLSKAVRVAQAEKVPIYTIDAAGTGVSVAEPRLPPPSLESRELAVRTLRDLAEGTGGEYFRADNTEAL